MDSNQWNRINRFDRLATCCLKPLSQLSFVWFSVMALASTFTLNSADHSTIRNCRDLSLRINTVKNGSNCRLRDVYSGAGSRGRTDDSLLGRQALYQLSYTRVVWLLRVFNTQFADIFVFVDPVCISALHALCYLLYINHIDNRSHIERGFHTPL